MRHTLLAMSLAFSAALPAAADDAVQMNSQNAGYDMDESMSLAFIFHIDEKLAEQDVFFEKVSGSGEVFRPTAATRTMDAPLYAPANAVPHTPLQIENTGPWARGKALGITLGQWFSAKGTGHYSCADGKGIVNLHFENLVPNGLYTVWHDFAIWPPTEPFLGFYDTPLGSRDGTENVFTADENGDAKFFRVITPCLQLTGEQLISELAIAWHSDGETHGPMTGEFSTQTHVHMYVPLPKRAGL